MQNGQQKWVQDITELGLGNACTARWRRRIDKKFCRNRCGSSTREPAIDPKHKLVNQVLGLHDEGDTDPKKTYQVHKEIPSIGQMHQKKDVANLERGPIPVLLAQCGIDGQERGYVGQKLQETQGC